jgi:hypothetical protein
MNVIEIKMEMEMQRKAKEERRGDKDGYRKCREI